MFLDEIAELKKNKGKMIGSCPLCNSPDSFAVKDDGKRWECSECGRGGNESYLAQLMWDISRRTADYVIDYWYDNKKLPFADKAEVQAKHRSLLESRKELGRLQKIGIDLETVKKYLIGINDLAITIPIETNGEVFVDIHEFIPIYRGDVSGLAKNKKKNKPFDVRYFPSDALNSDEVWIFKEIEEALMAKGYGFNAVACTADGYAAVDYFQSLKGKAIYIVIGHDDIRKVEAELSVFRQIVSNVNITTLPVKSFHRMVHGNSFEISPALFRRKYSKRLTDIVQSGSISSPLTAPISLIEAEFTDSQNELIGLNNMSVIGAEPRTYAIPRVLKVSCTKDNCDLAAGSHLVQVGDRDLLKFIDSPDSVQKGYLGERFHCKKIRHEVDSYINAQKVIFQEGASFVGGLDDATFESRYGVYLYDTYRLQATEKYDFEACKVSNPRNQFTNYVIHKARRRDDVADVELDIKYFKAMLGNAETMQDVIDIYYEEWNDVLEVQGRSDLFATILLTYASVTEIPFGVDSIKGWMDAMVIGDTRTGKSKMVQRFVKLMRMGSYINGENSRATGVIGGVQKYGESWIVTWGAIPMNDKGLLVIDEASGLEVNDIKNLSSTRSSGAVTLNKIVKGEARARTRLLWMSNPRSGRNLNEFFYQGFGAFQEFIPVAEDQSRFDIVISAAREDVEFSVIDNRRTHEPNYKKWQGLFRYAWTLNSKDIQFDEGANDALLRAVKDLNEEYGGGTMIIGVAVHEKLLRLACAFAVLTVSVEHYATLVVKPVHIKMACDFIKSTLAKKTFGYNVYIQEVKDRREQKIKNIEYMRSTLRVYPAFKILLSAPNFKGSQVAEVLGMEKMECSTILSRMLVSGLIKPASNSSYAPSDVLIEIMKEIEC